MKKEILSWVGCFAVAIVLALLIVTFVGQRVRVDGKSMESTLQDNDNLICDKISYRFKDPERFDIVVIHPYEEESNGWFGDFVLWAKRLVFLAPARDRWIKRIIGLPGEEVRIDTQGNIYINGEILEESYGKEVIQDPGMAIEPIQLGDDEYWVMGDNRNHSSDSRVIGPVPRDRIVGRAFVRIFPFNKIGFIKHQ